MKTKKLKVMEIERTGEEDDTHIEINDEYTYLGGLFTENYDDAFGTRKRIGLQKIPQKHYRTSGK